MNSLVTGGAGFIGSHLVDALLARGDEVIVVDDLSTGRWENLITALNRGARLEAVNVTDATAVDRVVAQARPERIFHLAAQIDVRHAVADPARDATVNLIGTVTMLEAARRHGVARFVLASTGGAIYGDADRIPTPETARPRPGSPYAASKAAAESYLELYRELHGLSTHQPAAGQRLWPTAGRRRGGRDRDLLRRRGRRPRGDPLRRRRADAGLRLCRRRGRRVRDREREPRHRLREHRHGT